MIAGARELMGSGLYEGTCGPYTLVAQSPDRDALRTCERIGLEIERVYIQRFGVTPVGEPRGTVLLFDDREAYREFARTGGNLNAGYAGFSRPSRSLVVLAPPQHGGAFATTFAHEIAHLLHRRTFGPDLPPWLSEGLADAVGDTATTDGFTPLDDLTGMRTQIERLRAAQREDRVRPISELVALTRDVFDRDPRSVDYEMSALLVRFLLLDREFSPRFSRVLQAVADGEVTPAEPLEFVAGNAPERLTASFNLWLQEKGTGD